MKWYAVTGRIPDGENACKIFMTNSDAEAVELFTQSIYAEEGQNRSIIAGRCGWAICLDSIVESDTEIRDMGDPRESLL